MISTYVWTLNTENVYPLEACIRSAMPLDGEIIILDCGSIDNTIEVIKSLQEECKNIKLYQTRWDATLPGIDGLLKARARKFCTGEWCFQLDADEVIRAEDIEKIKSLVSAGDFTTGLIGTINFYSPFSIILLPEIGIAKPRLSRNFPFITHGIPKRSRRIQCGKVIALPDTDGTDLIDLEGNCIPFEQSFVSEQYQTLLTKSGNIKEREAILQDTKENDVTIYVLHYGSMGLEKKITNWSAYWFNAWETLYGKSNIVVTDEMRREHIEERIRRFDKAAFRYTYNHDEYIKKYYKLGDDKNV